MNIFNKKISNGVNLTGKKILIFQQRGWGLRVGHFLAKKLAAEGARLAALTLKRSTHKFVVEQREVNYDLIVNNDEIMGDPVTYLAGETISLAEICKDLGVDSVWPLVWSLRNYVMSYKDKYYYSFRQNVSDEDMIAYVMAMYKCIRDIFAKFTPDLILAPNFVGLPHLMFHLYAKKRGVRMIGVADAKVRGVNVFSYSYVNDEGPFYDRIEELNEGRADSENREKAKKYIAECRKSMMHPEYFDWTQKSKSVWKKVRSEIAPYYHILRWYIKRPINYLPVVGPTPDYRPPRIILRDHFARKRYRKFYDNFSYYPFEKLGRFAYFPLQFQPEATLDVISPYFNNQIELARLIAMSLPDDITLAVREHPAMIGLRSSAYLEKLARTPNVKVIDYRVPSDDVLKRAALVVSPSGTTLAEAAFYNKPAIQFGNLGTTLRMPNVTKHTDMTTLPKKIREVLSQNLQTPEYERRLENFVAAAYDTGFNYNYVGFWVKGSEADLEGLWSAYLAEIERSVIKL
ncbi:MAG: hypothetical protein UY65_C0001G0027 [Parcubacteria group bacterium GW2011_GWA2_51_12]|nr:MAG: hypothetical protein UY65_C0001G0027 [Parcubacteria group bacterium GW2011_GWA2_51_12]